MKNEKEPKSKPQGSRVNPKGTFSQQSAINNQQSLATSRQRPATNYRLWGKFPFLTPVILALRNMRVRWMRTLLTCLGIVLGVAVILAIAIANESTLKSIRDVFDEASGKANLLVLSSSADGG